MSTLRKMPYTIKTAEGSYDVVQSLTDGIVVYKNKKWLAKHVKVSTLKMCYCGKA